MTAEINVRHGGGQYPVLVGAGLLDDAGALARARLASNKAAVVTDDNVAPHYLKPVLASLEAQDFAAQTFTLPAGEETKSFDNLEKLVSGFLDFGLGRDDCVIALGGGVVGDIAGLAAGLTRRGAHLVMAPTTLLAQTDSAVGGKTAVNMKQGKNLAGMFYPPALVIADVATFKTLPPRQLRAGYAEAVKHAVIDGEDHFAFLEGALQRNLAGDPEALAETVKKSVTVKGAVVAADEREAGARMTLNLGHTFGHALEAWAGYSDKLLHGEAVAIGLCLAFRFAGAKDMARVKKHLEAAGLPTDAKVKNLKPETSELMAFMRQDKKGRAGKIRLILPRAIGNVYIEDDVSEKDIKDFLDAELA